MKAIKALSALGPLQLVQSKAATVYFGWTAEAVVAVAVAGSSSFPPPFSLPQIESISQQGSRKAGQLLLSFRQRCRILNLGGVSRVMFMCACFGEEEERKPSWLVG